MNIVTKSFVGACSWGFDMGCLAEILEKKKLYAFEDRPIIREFFGRENSNFLEVLF